MFYQYLSELFYDKFLKKKSDDFRKNDQKPQKMHPMNYWIHTKLSINNIMIFSTYILYLFSSIKISIFP